MNEQALRFRIGVFVLAGLLLLAVLITLFGSFPRLFIRAHEYTVRFADAPGVEQGTPVRRSGVRVGEVKHVSLDDETGEVRVQIIIEHQYTLRHNEQPTLVHGLLGGDTSIDFVPVRAAGEEADRSPVPPGSELAGVRQPTVNTLLAGAADVLPTTQESLNELRKAAQRYEQMAPLLEETAREYRDLAKATREMVPQLNKSNDQLQATLITWQKTGERAKVILDKNEDKIGQSLDSLNDSLKRANNVLSDENQRNLSAALRNIRTGTDNLPSISKNTDELLRESQKTMRRVNDSLAKADEVMGNLQQATKPFADRSPAIARNLDESTNRLNTVLADLQELFKALDRGDGTLKKLITDPSLYNRLDQALCVVNRLLPKLEPILRDVNVFTDKIARHPESLGVRGAISPGSGLKESPTPLPLPAWNKPQ